MIRCVGVNLTTIILHRELLSSIQQVYPYVKGHTHSQHHGSRVWKETSDPVLAQIRLHLINLSLGIND